MCPVSISDPLRRIIVWSRKVSKPRDFIQNCLLVMLIGSSTTVLPMCLSNFKAIRWFRLPISQLRDFTRSYDELSSRIMRQGPGEVLWDRRGGDYMSSSTCSDDMLYSTCSSNQFNWSFKSNISAQNIIMAIIQFLHLSDCNILQWSLPHFRSWSADIGTASCAVKMNRCVALYYLPICYRRCRACWML